MTPPDYSGRARRSKGARRRGARRRIGFVSQIRSSTAGRKLALFRKFNVRPRPPGLGFVPQNQGSAPPSGIGFVLHHRRLPARREAWLRSVETWPGQPASRPLAANRILRTKWRGGAAASRVCRNLDQAQSAWSLPIRASMVNAPATDDRTHRAVVTQGLRRGDDPAFVARPELCRCVHVDFQPQDS
jgi:hypothetical protein